MTTKVTGHLGMFLLLVLAMLAFPQSALAAEEGGSKWGVLLFIGRLFNLAIVVGLLVWVARRPLADFYASRTQTIREQLADAERARAEAESRLAEIESRMSHLDDELLEIKAAAERDARAEYDRLLAQAQADAEKIIQRARQDIEGLTRAAQIELRSHAAELSVRMAEERIRREITEDDRRRLFVQFVTKVGENQ